MSVSCWSYTIWEGKASETDKLALQVKGDPQGSPSLTTIKPNYKAHGFMVKAAVVSKFSFDNFPAQVSLITPWPRTHEAAS